MKFGLRTPSLKKSISARTTGRLTRSVKRTVLPGYGKKGGGLLTDPKRSIYNRVYDKTSFGVGDIADAVTPKGTATKPEPCDPVFQPTDSAPAKKGRAPLIIAAILAVLGLISLIASTSAGFFGAIGFVILGMALLFIGATVAVMWCFM